MTISIHALLAESDWPPIRDIIQWEDFYPRSPCGERLFSFALASLFCVISIHALLAESDPSYKLRIHQKQEFLSTLSLRRATALIRYLINTYHHFYPRSPCGERHAKLSYLPVLFVFLSTLSLRRATLFMFSKSTQKENFYPRSPCGERLYPDGFGFLKLLISIHALLAESDRQMPLTRFFPGTFLSTLSLRRATRE